MVIDAAVLERATKIFVEDQAPAYRDSFEKATQAKRKTKYDNYRVILRALSSGPEGLTRAELLNRVQQIHSGYPASNLHMCLNRLATNGDRGGLIMKDPVTQHYRFRDPLACAYAKMRFSKEKWADHVILAADFGPDGRVKSLEVRRDEGPLLGDAQDWNRAEVIDSMTRGTTFVTGFEATDGWFRADAVTLVYHNGEPFLRVDGLSIGRDDLGSQFTD